MAGSTFYLVFAIAQPELLLIACTSTPLAMVRIISNNVGNNPRISRFCRAPPRRARQSEYPNLVRGVTLTVLGFSAFETRRRIAMNQKGGSQVPGYSSMAGQGPDNAYRSPHPHAGYTSEQMQSYAARPVGMVPGHYPGMYPPGYEEQIRAQSMMRQQPHLQQMHHMNHPSMRAQIPIIMPHPAQMYGVHPQQDMRAVSGGRVAGYEAPAEGEEQDSSAEDARAAADAKGKNPGDGRQSYGDAAVRFFHARNSAQQL